jgi:hypothetical protein
MAAIIKQETMLVNYFLMVNDKRLPFYVCFVLLHPKDWQNKLTLVISAPENGKTSSLWSSLPRRVAKLVHFGHLHPGEWQN